MSSSLTNPQLIEVGEAQSGERLDKVIATLFAELSRAQARALIEEGGVCVNSQTVTSPRHGLKTGDIITFGLEKSEEAVLKGEAIPLDILYEDEHVIVINKPSGLTVHPGAGVYSGTLVNALLHHAGKHLSRKGGYDRPGIVHRLDKETSGVMVVAKTDLAYDSLTAQFADHGRTGDLERAYTALVWGQPYPRSGTIDAPLGRSKKNRVKMAVVPLAEGREAITHYHLIETLEPEANLTVSLIECQLETGRTHQIRVHFAHIKCPVLGDPVYGQGFATKANLLSDEAKHALDALGRQALHAHYLAFAHPETGEVMAFESPLPDDFAHLLATLGGGEGAKAD